MAYGDQPSLIMEQIEWARLNGFQVICAGKGTNIIPHLSILLLKLFGNITD